MKTQQLETIAALRQENYSYNFIAKELGLSPNTVKSICQRRGFQAMGKCKTKREKAEAMLCENCHRPLPKGKRPDSRFCSGYCRTRWWRAHRRVIEKTP